LLRLVFFKEVIVQNAARAVALALNGLIHPALDVLAEFREARNMDEERFSFELALNGGVNFGMAEGAEAAVAGICRSINSYGSIGRDGSECSLNGMVFSHIGKSIDGYTTKISSGGYIKSPNFITTVRYFQGFPYLNVLEEETKPTLGQLVLIVAGSFLIYAMNSRKVIGKRKFQLRRKI